MRSILPLIIAIAVLAGCADAPTEDAEGVARAPTPIPTATSPPAAIPSEPREVPAEGEHGYSAAEASDCVSQGGEYYRRGLLGQYGCALPYADGGKDCSKASDCIGQCTSIDPKATSGTCQRTDAPFGCYTFFDEYGNASGICVD